MIPRNDANVIASSGDPVQTASLGAVLSGSALFVQLVFPKILDYYDNTLMTLSFRTDRSGQTVQIQIRLLLEEQSDQGLHCLLYHLHLFDEKTQGLASLFEF